MMKIAKALSVLFAVFCVAAPISAAETIRLANGEWVPYQSQSLKHCGAVSRIVTEAFASEGITVEYEYYPWKRGYVCAETGEVDGTFLWFDTAERRATFYISDPVIDIQYVFFHLKNYAFDWNTVDDLQGITVGATVGYDLGEAFQEAEQDNVITVERVTTDEQNFQKLVLGRVQIFPCDIEVGYAVIRKLFPPDQAELFTHHTKPLKAAPHHLLLSKKNERNKQMIELFNKGLQKLKDSGRYEQYLVEMRANIGLSLSE
jgi:polar amino acid transport system substrate-binding protein